MMMETGFVNKNMLIGYARVSTMDQNPALQMDALRDIGCERIFVEKASGSHRDRPQLKAALDYLREGDTLAVWKLSRLARSLTQVIKTAADIAERGIALKVLTQNIDTCTPEGRLFFHMTAAFDEFQRELIVENTRAGLKAAAKRGRRGGRPKAMNQQNIKHAEAMLKDTENYPFIGDVIDQLKIGRTAFYKYFPTDRIKQLRSEHSDAPQT
jgi:DNA invertase Pin-like site-specific DNA recombinase